MALEYEEEDEPQAAVVREAELPIPNIPIPDSADGNVSASHYISTAVSQAYGMYIRRIALGHSHAQLRQIRFSAFPP